MDNPIVMSVDFSKHRTPPGLEMITVRQKFGVHTVAFADFREVPAPGLNHLPMEDTPVTLNYGAGPIGVRTTYGYVNHYENLTSGKKALTRMVLLGTSKVMNTMTPSVWMGQSHPSIVREIAIRHRFRSVAHSHSLLRETWSSGDRTDFKALRDLAEEIGFKVWVDGATVWFVDPERLVRSASTMSTPLVRDQDIRKVQVLRGSNIPGEMVATKRRVQYGIDARTQNPFLATSGNPLDPVEMTVGTAYGYGEAYQDVRAKEKRQRDQVVLKATFAGNASFTPGTVIEVERGSNRDQGAVWMINEAEHVISAQEFTTSVVCTRGTDSADLARLPVTLQNATGTPRAVLRAVHWEAELQEQVHV